MVRSQICTLIPYLFLGHNLCFKYSNESCKLILDIYISRYFQWYKKIFNVMIFDLWNIFIKIQVSIGILTPKMGIHLRVCGFIHSHSREWKSDSRVALSTHMFPCLYLGHKPKAKVMTFNVLSLFQAWWIMITYENLIFNPCFPSFFDCNQLICSHCIFPKKKS